MKPTLRTALRLAGLASLGACASFSVARPTTLGQPRSQFSAVRLDASFEVRVIEGGACGWKVLANHSDAANVSIVVRNGSLIVGSKSSHRFRKVVVTVTMPTVRAVELRGSGKIDMQHLHGRSLAVSISGTGPVSVHGSEQSLALSISGAGEFSGRDLACYSAAVSISGTGNAHLKPSKSLTVAISGSGDVVYVGNPSVVKKITGTGEVRKA